MKRFPSWTPILRRWLLAAAAAATIIAAAWVEEDFRGQRALERFEKECADEGKPLEYDFYKPAPVANAQNMFRAPVLARFFNCGEDDLPAWVAYERGKPPLADMAKVLGNWREGTRSDLKAIYGILGKDPRPGPDAGPGAAAGLILDALRGIQPDLDAVGAAARDRPQSQIAFGNFMLPSFRALRFFSRALALRAVAEIELGRSDDAFRDVYASLRLAEGAERFPHHISLLMSNVIVSLSLQPLWEGCVRESWSDGQLRSFQELFSRIHPLRELPAAFAAGRAAYAVGYIKDSRKPFWMPEGWWKINVVRFFQLHAGGGDPLWFDPAIEQINLTTVQQSDALIDKLKSSYSPFDWLIRHEAWGTQIAVLAAYEHNQLTVARAACALERYRLLHGRYPAELSALVPAFLESVPLDVVDRNPLHYQCADGRHPRLYSIGLSGFGSHSWRRILSAWATKEGYWAWTQ
jgi:hypothetical protein